MTPYSVPDHGRGWTAVCSRAWHREPKAVCTREAGSLQPRDLCQLRGASADPLVRRFAQRMDLRERSGVTCVNLSGSDFGRTDFLRIFIFGPPDFFADFVAGFFLLIFVGKSAQKNPPAKSPAKSSKNYTTKIPDNFLQRGRAKIYISAASA